MVILLFTRTKILKSNAVTLIFTRNAFGVFQGVKLNYKFNLNCGYKCHVDYTRPGKDFGEGKIYIYIYIVDNIGLVARFWPVA